MNEPAHSRNEHGSTPERGSDQLKRENLELRRRSHDLQQTLDQVMSSRSWRLTAKLRRALGLFRAFFPLWRERHHLISFSAGRNIAQSQGSFSVAGPSSYLTAKSDRGLIPWGWVKIKAHMRSQQPHIFFLLHYAHQAGVFSGDQRISLGISCGENDLGMLRLPNDNCDLRLDPFDARAEFAFDKFEIIEVGKLQVLAHLSAKYLRLFFADPSRFLGKLASVARIWRSGGLAALRAKLMDLAGVWRRGGVAALQARIFGDASAHDYGEWVKRYDTLSVEDKESIKQAATALPNKPLISVVMPVYNTPEKYLRAAIDSVLLQLYPNWELCVADDASTEPHVAAVLEQYSAQDSRIKLIKHQENGHISKATNSALSLCQGQYVAFLDHDDELREHALYMVAQEINAQPQAALIYSDEDKITVDGVRFNPYFKPDWNPDLLLSQNYVCHLLVIKRALIEQVGGCRENVEGAQDWDLILRASEKIDERSIRHIPQVLYHWRVAAGSTASSTSYKPYVMQAQARTVSEHLTRQGFGNFQVDILDDISQIRVKFALPNPAPLVSLIIPTRNQVKLLRTCVQSILHHTNYDNLELIVIDNGSSQDETLVFLDELKSDRRCRVVRDESAFNFSRLNNSAAKLARGSVLGFLNNDLEVIGADWLRELVSQLMRPGIAACGARLLYPGGQVQHAGVILGIGGVAGHSHKGRKRFDVGYFNRLILTHDVSAVTAACMLIKRDLFEAVGGFDEQELSVAFNDVDLCLKLRAAGHKIVFAPYAELYHYESASRGHENTPEKFIRFEREIEVMQKRWGVQLQNDPYYNPNLTILTEDFALAFPPRVLKPWRRQNFE